MRTSNAAATAATLGECDGPQAEWMHGEDGHDELRSLAGGKCLTRAARLDDCSKADADPTRFAVHAVHAVRATGNSYEVFFPYNHSTQYFLQYKWRDLSGPSVKDGFAFRKDGYGYFRAKSGGRTDVYYFWHERPGGRQRITLRRRRTAYPSLNSY